MVADIDAVAVQATAREVEEEGGRALAVTVDVTAPDSVRVLSDVAYDFGTRHRRHPLQQRRGARVGRRARRHAGGLAVDHRRQPDGRRQRCGRVPAPDDRAGHAAARRQHRIGCSAAGECRDACVRRLEGRGALTVRSTSRPTRRHERGRVGAVPGEHRESHPRCAAQPAVVARQAGAEPMGTDPPGVGIHAAHVASAALEAIRNDELYVFTFPEDEHAALRRSAEQRGDCYPRGDRSRRRPRGEHRRRTRIARSSSACTR